MQLAAKKWVAEAGVSRRLCQPSGWRRQQQQQRAPARRVRLAPQAGLKDAFGGIFDFESWAPKSSQAWRLGNNPADLRRADRAGLTQDDEDVLNARLVEARQAPGAAAARSEVAAAAAAAEQQADLPPQQQQPSFLRSTDEEVASALNDRIAQVAAAGGSACDDDSVEGAALTGTLLRELIYQKWGKTYDLSFVRRDLPLGKTLICLNVMWTHLEQRTFPMSEEEYDEKLDLIALYLNSWGQADRVESFLRQPARPRKGMPSKPIVGTAISIQLDPDEAVIEEFFSQGGV